MNELHKIVLKDNMTTCFAEFTDYGEAQMALDMLNMRGREDCIMITSHYESSAEDFMKKYVSNVSYANEGHTEFDFIRTLEERLDYVKTRKTYPIELKSAEHGFNETYDMNIESINWYLSILSLAFYDGSEPAFRRGGVYLYPDDIKKFHAAKAKWEEDCHRAARDLERAQLRKAGEDDDEYYV
ncbi:MAG: hypothetical protein IJW24_01725 [Clostridia bacterium]|nr:hypothetical protein [Clostridia bacterium]